LTKTNKGKLVGIGVGPGDSELLTLKAAKILNEIPVICSPRSAPNKESIALSIVNPIIEKRKDFKQLTVLEPVFPMVEDSLTLEKHWDEASELIANFLNKGLDVAFITLGDPSIYSTFSYVQKRLETSYSIEIIPGITSFSACASSIKRPLVEKDDVLIVIPKIKENFEILLENGNTIALMKTSRNKKELENKINHQTREKEIFSVENCTMENEKIINGFSENKPYLSTTIIKFKK
jgi:precorrin-2/cobalt-factor-2 C20-methyltransferase